MYLLIIKEKFQEKYNKESKYVMQDDLIEIK